LRYEARRLDSAIGTVFTGAFANYTFEYVTEMDLVVIPEPQTSNLLLLALAGLYGLTLSDDRRRTRA
jgi:hypothetical protein